MPPHATTQVYQAFIDFMIHIIHEVEQSPVAMDPWQHTLGYTVWFYMISH